MKQKVIGTRKKFPNAVRYVFVPFYKLSFRSRVAKNHASVLKFIKSHLNRRFEQCNRYDSYKGEFY